MCSNETVPFTVQGPIFILADTSSSQGFGNAGFGLRTGSTLLELKFQYPCQVGEILFTNYYTACVSVFVKRATSKRSQFSKDNYGARGKYSRSVSISTDEGMVKDTRMNLTDEQELSCTPGHSTSKHRRRHNSNPSSSFDLSDLSWELSIESKTLMPFANFEAGSQDVISIPATESKIELKDVIMMRIYLYQPSKVWERFSIEDINVFKNLPKAGYSNYDANRQRNNWFSNLSKNTLKYITQAGVTVEPENSNTSQDDLTN